MLGKGAQPPDNVVAPSSGKETPVFAQPIALATFLVVALAAHAVRTARAEREAQRQMDMFELGMRVARSTATR